MDLTTAQICKFWACIWEAATLPYPAFESKTVNKLEPRKPRKES